MAGRDKGLVKYNGKPLIEHVLERLLPQLPSIVININRNHSRYIRYGLELYSDQRPDFQGPLAGISSAFKCCDSPYLLIVPCDTPQLPSDLAIRLVEALEQQASKLAVVESPAGLQPLCCLIHHSLKASLNRYLQTGGRRVQEWIRQQNPAICHYESDEPFININSLDDAPSTKGLRR